LHVTDSGCMREQLDRGIIFCVLMACHRIESTRLRNIYTAVREYYYCILRWGYNIPPGRGTTRLKNGTSRRKRDGWQS